MALPQTTNDGMVISTKINLVDLAGSERLGKTGVTGQQAAEGRSINLSLSTLGNVIRALGKKNAVPPSRQSQLTMSVCLDCFCSYAILYFSSQAHDKQAKHTPSISLC